MTGPQGNNTSGDGVRKIPTGITGFDEMLEGGIPRGRALLVSGPAGSGKTVFLNQFLYKGVTVFGENGVFVTLEEKPEDIRKNVRNFGWDYAQLEKEGKLVFVDAGPARGLAGLEAGADYDLTPLLARITAATTRHNAGRVAIDGLANLFSRFSNTAAVRQILFQISGELKSMGVTTMISAEKLATEENISRFGVEDFICDGVIVLEMPHGQQQFLRKIFVKKLRGVGYRSGIVEFRITGAGVEVFPKIPVDRSVASTSFAERKGTGIPELDELADGGIPRGHMVLVSGNTGTGKTLLGMHFLTAGLRQGEKCLYVTLEEPRTQLIKTAEQFTWPFGEYERSGNLFFLNPDLIDISPDDLLYRIVTVINENKISRIFFDSVSSLLSATMNQEQARQFLIQLTGSLKNQGVTAMMSYLTAAVFGAARGQLLGNLSSSELRLSSLTDGILLLRYVERDQSVRKLLNILKMRGSRHSPDIYSYEINRQGFRIGKQFEK